MRRGAGTAAAALVLFAAGCAPSLMKLPAGAGTPASDAADAFIDATAACNAVSSISAEIAVAGAVGGRRLHARLLAGLASPASARLEAVAPAGQPLFILVASGDDATLLFPREQRVLPHGQPAAVLEAVAGIPLDPIDLRATLTGCSLAAPENGRRLGEDWRAVTVGSNDVYLRRSPRESKWQLVAVVHHASAGAREWRAEYAGFEAGLPRSVRLTSAPDDRFDLRLTLSQVELNAQLGPEVFRVEIPPGAEPMTLEELKRSGPLGSGGAGGSGARLRQGYGGSAVARRNIAASGGWKAPAPVQESRAGRASGTAEAGGAEK